MTLMADMNLMSVASNVASGVNSQAKFQLIAVDARLPRLDILLADLAPTSSLLLIESYLDAIAILKGVDTTQLTAKNFESV